MRTKKGSRRTALTPNRWAGMRMLETAHRLNARCFALLAETAQMERAGIAWNAVCGPQALWAQVDARVCERAGRCPVLLLDLNFQRPDWWSRIHLDHPVNLRVSSPSAAFSAEQAVPLLREILIEAWSIGRSMPSAASLLFGMAPPVSRAIAGLSVPDVDRVVIEHARYLRPRWEENRRFWTRLLQAAVGNDKEGLANTHLHCLQLLGGDLALGHS